MDHGGTGDGAQHPACASKSPALSENAMHAAATQGNLTAIKLLMDNGADVDEMDSDGISPLYTAVQHCRWSAVDFLFQNGANVDASTLNSSSLLFEAIKKCDHFTADVLMQLGADTNLTDREFRSFRPLHVAARKDCRGIVELLVRRGTDVNQESDEGGPLSIATTHADIEIVKFLINKGAEVNPPSTHKPLLEATKAGRTEAMRYLLANGADVNATEVQEGEASLHYAAFYGFLDAANLLLDAGAMVDAKDDSMHTPLHLAAFGYKDNADMINLLLDHKAEINARDTYLFTPLHFSHCNDGFMCAMERRLISRGADVTARDINGMTPLHNAALKGNSNYMLLLIANGALLNARCNFHNYFSTLLKPETFKILQEYEDLLKLLTKGKLKLNITSSGYTAMELAILKGNEEAVQILLNKGAEPNPKNSPVTPLNLACLVANKSIVQMLIGYSADTNLKDSAGWTPLHKAAFAGNADVVNFLLDNNASIEARDVFDWTPLHVAAKYTRSEVVRILLDSKSVVDATDAVGFTPLIWAEAGGHRNLLNHIIHKGDQSPGTRYQAQLKESASEEYRVIVKALLAAGAAIDSKDAIFGWTTLHWAAASGDLSMVEYLIGKGALKHIKSNQGLTPMGLARQYGNMDVYKYMKAGDAVW